jgi:hypothetical protein
MSTCSMSTQAALQAHLGIVLRATNELRRHPIRRSDDGSALLFVDSELRSESKVALTCQLQSALRCVLTELHVTTTVDQDVVGLDVAMDAIDRVHELEASQHLVQCVRNVRLAVLSTGARVRARVRVSAYLVEDEMLNRKNVSQASVVHVFQHKLQH